MDYTQSDAFVTHPGTGHRMHQDDQPVTTEVSANDLNMVIWSLMEFLQEAGLSGVPFDDESPDSYRQLLAAFDTLYARAPVFASVADLRLASKESTSLAFVTGYYAPGDGGGGQYRFDPSDTTSTDDGGILIVGTDGGRWKLVHQGAVSVKQYGAKGDWNGVSGTNDAARINAAIAGLGALGGGEVIFPPGRYRTTDAINQTYSTICLRSGQKYAAIIEVDHAGNGLNLASNNEPRVDGLFIRRVSIGARGSRTGVGVRVFGDIAGGSSIQARVDRCRVEGFSRGLDLYGCFLSVFDDITLKQNDVSIYLNNNTNSSVLFTRVKSNLSVGQHVLCNGGAAETGATFGAGCEFENGNKFPAFAVLGGTQFFLTFNDAYAYENNAGTDAGSSFNLIELAVAGKLVIRGGGWSAGGKADARLIYGRRNASVVRWDVTLGGVQLVSRRIAGPDIDVDFNEANGDSCYVSPSCNYRNPDSPSCDISYGSNSLYRSGPNVLYKLTAELLQLRNMVSTISGKTNGVQWNAGASLNWQANVEIFASNNGTNFTTRWADSSGVWRTKHATTLAGALPTSDTDGTVIGTQT